MNYKDVVYNTSRIINLPSALKEGNLLLLKDLLDDRIHTPYRLNLIPDAEKIKSIAFMNNLPFAISGAGSSLLILSKDDEIIKKLKDEIYHVHYNFYDLKIDKVGATIEVKYHE